MAKLNTLFLSSGLATLWLYGFSVGLYDVYWGWTYNYHRDLLAALPILLRFGELFVDIPSFLICVQNSDFFRGSIVLILLGIVTPLMAVAIMYLRSRFREVRTVQLLADIRETVPSFKFIFGALFLLLNCIALVEAVDLLPDVWHYGLRDIAYGADIFGNYELGEQIFGLTRDSLGCSLASTCGAHGHDSNRSEIVEQRLNRAVARVYGPASLEMAHRLTILANHLDSNFGDKAAAEKARVDADGLFISLNQTFARAENLAFLIYTQAAQHKYTAARHSLNTALELTSALDTPDIERIRVRSYMIAGLCELGEMKMAKQAQIDQLNNLPRTQESCIPITCVSVWILFLLLSARLIPLWRRDFFDRLDFDWRSRMQNSKSPEAKIVFLNRLINLALYRGRIESADELSRQMLALVCTE